MRRNMLDVGILVAVLLCLPAILFAGEPMAPMPLAAPLFIEDERYSSALTIVNEANQQVDATLTIQDLSGRAIITRQLTLPAHSRRELQMKDLLKEARVDLKAGSLSLQQDPRLNGMDVAAQLSITHTGDQHPSYIEEEFAMPSHSGSSVLRAVGDAVPLLALKSLSSPIIDQSVTVTCVTERKKPSAQEYRISGQETLLVKPCKMPNRGQANNSDATDGDRQSTLEHLNFEGLQSNGPVGISITTNGPPGELAAFGIIPHRIADELYFTAMTFTDPTMLRSSDTVYTGVPVGSSLLLPEGDYTPVLYVANFGDRPSAGSVTYASALPGSTSRVVRTITRFTIPGNASQVVDLPGVEPNSTLQTSFIVTSGAAPGNLQSKLVAVGSGSLHAVELLGKDGKEEQNGGGHPWSVATGDNSTLLLFNTSNNTKVIQVKISSDAVLDGVLLVVDSC